jgi:hypothetical protein
LARKIRFRQQRLYELRIAIVLVLFVAVLFSGLFVVDLNKSYVMYGEPRTELIQINHFDNDIYEVNVLNSKFNLNLKYMMKDINNIKSFFNINN